MTRQPDISRLPDSLKFPEMNARRILRASYSNCLLAEILSQLPQTLTPYSNLSELPQPKRDWLEAKARSLSDRKEISRLESHAESLAREIANLKKRRVA
jgi:hypothetical protein